MGPAFHPPYYSGKKANGRGWTRLQCAARDKHWFPAHLKRPKVFIVCTAAVQARLQLLHCIPRLAQP